MSFEITAVEHNINVSNNFIEQETFTYSPSLFKILNSKLRIFIFFCNSKSYESFSFC